MAMAAGDSSASGATLGDSIIRSLGASGVGPSEGGASQIWFDGDVLSCACPDCGAPLAIRLWLRLAECGMCGTRVELSEEFEQLAQQLLERRERGEAVPGAPPAGPWSHPVGPKPSAARGLPILSPPITAPPAPPAIQAPVAPRTTAPPLPVPKPAAAPLKAMLAEPVYELAGEPVAAQLAALPAPLSAPPLPTPALKAPPLPVPSLPVPPPIPAAPAPRAAAAAAPRAAAPAPPRAVPHHPSRGIRRELMRQLIACLASMVFHTVLILILGMLFVERTRPPAVYLEVDMRQADGGPKGAVIVPKAHDESAGRQSVSIATMPDAVGQRLSQEIQMRAEPMQMANRLVVAPSLSLKPASGGGAGAIGTLIGGRSPTVRAGSLFDEGGTEETELAVAMGLKWLAKHQNPDGSWSLDHFDKTGDCNGKCTEAGQLSDTAGTALALLPFLGAGHTHREGEYKETVERGLQWLVQNRHERDGWMGEGAGRMYAHGQVAIALCEAYALTNDSKLRGPAQQAIDFIVEAQHAAGGWRYFPGEPGDMSIVGWQLMALRSAQMSDLRVPAEVLERSNGFLDSVQMNKNVARFAYKPGLEPTETMTAEGMLCRLYAGRETTDATLTTAADYLLQKHPPAINKPNMYYWYYGTQVMHHLGGSRWKRWNERMRKLLVDMQIRQGHQTGSWTPREYPDTAGGRLYMTALAVCTLEVYYRHLPLYRNRALLR
jgi:hypothetical protein